MCVALSYAQQGQEGARKAFDVKAASSPLRRQGSLGREGPRARGAACTGESLPWGWRIQS